jgi:hypothetical protein
VKSPLLFAGGGIDCIKVAVPTSKKQNSIRERRR